MEVDEMRQLQEIRFHFAKMVSNFLDNYMPIYEGASRHIDFVDLLVDRIMTCYSDRQWLESGFQKNEN